MKETIKLKAHDKAMSRIHGTKLEIKRLKQNIERKTTGVLTLDDLKLCLDAAKRELETWNYIMKLIELDYGKHDYVDGILGSQRDYDIATAG